MRLSKIKLSGFKSFVDPTTIAFPSNLLGIVGPNGCGKSNIIDAIRWVLGEKSAKTLRGDSMADVIFSGSSERKPVGQASIELNFDNSDGTITGPYAGYSEVAVRRVVSRDGTSQYYLNKSRCRRKDIAQLLLGTGLGAHGYSIIEQGMISRLVEAKPEELRAFLEEAAGISKYKERRRDTEHRIRHTRENLDRLSDLREEIESQLAQLKRQARGAERYKSLKEQQRRVNAEVLALHLVSLNEEIRSQESELNAKQVILDAEIAKQRGLENRIERLRDALNDRNDDFNRVQGNYYKVGAEIARLEQSIKHRKELTQRQSEELEATDGHLQEISSHIRADVSEIEEFDRLLQELNPGLEQARDSQRTSEEILRNSEIVVENWREDWDRVATEIAETERRVDVEKAKIEQFSGQRLRIERETEKLNSEHANLNVTAFGKQLENLIADEETSRAACDQAKQAADSFWNQIHAQRERDRSESVNLDKARSNLQKQRGRLTSLEALQEVALGKSSENVNGWLDAQDLGSKPRLVQNLVVTTGWERAVETVLGDYLQAVCVESIDALAESLSDLTDVGVTLLSERAPVQKGRVDTDKLSAYVEGPGISSLLAGVRVAESFQDALSLRQSLSETESVITREGIWIGQHWIRINRGDDPQVGMLEREEQIKELRNAIQTGTRVVSESEKTLLEIRAQLENLEKVGAQTQEDYTKHQTRYGEAKNELEIHRARLEQERTRSSDLSRGITELESEKRSVGDALQESEANLSIASARYCDLELEQDRLEQAREHHQQKVTEARQRANNDRENAQAVALKIESQRSSKDSKTVALERVREQKEHLLSRQKNLKHQVEIAGAPLLDEEQKLMVQLDEQLQVESSLADARRSLELTDEELRVVEQERTDKEQDVNGARKILDDSRLVVREAQVRAETIKDQFSQTNFDFDVLVAELPGDATIELWKKSFEKIERSIHRLGNINLLAIDELKEQSERKEYLDAQFADLNSALETLENAIRKIDRETRMRFKDTFDKANEGLGRLFPRLFGGGHAFLDLDGNDLLNSGVTIMARPPGKRISTIHLMSGGEKALTAVALVFSIFELNPAPFCLLDEVDAPLDDANVGRFSEIVKEMSQQVQFVLITHNKTTMETMQQLIGVTMSEPGVSRLVAVDIDEAVQLAAM